MQRPANLFAETAEEAAEVGALLENGEPQDLIEAGERIAADREERLRRQLLANAKKRGKFFDASVFAAAIRAGGLMAYEPVEPWECLSPTPGQLEILERHGIDGVTCRGQASQIIGKIIKRREQGLATPKQLRHLVAHEVEGAECKSFQEAGKLLEEIFHE